MRKAKSISVVIPVYNGASFIRQCLGQVVNQSCKDLEIIVVDDGSVDESAEIAKEFPVILIQHDKNRGLSAARNTGIDTAKGDFIHFMDVDDTINNDFYQNLLEAVRQTDVDIACSGMINKKFKHKTILFKKLQVYTSTRDKLKATYVGRWGYVWRYLFQVEFLKQHQLRFEEGRFIEDLMFTLPAVYFAKKLVVVPKAEYTYYERENSIMTKKDKAHQEKLNQDWLYAKSFMLSFGKKHNFKIPGVNTGRLEYLLWKFLK